MLCEKCGQEQETARCGGCGNEVWKLGPYCYRCGAKFPAAVIEASAEDDDFSKRVLCSDGTCIGVVNEEGICKVCGKPYSSES